MAVDSVPRGVVLSRSKGVFFANPLSSYSFDIIKVGFRLMEELLLEELSWCRRDYHGLL